MTNQQELEIMNEIILTLKGTQPARRKNEPVTCGVPLPQELVHDPRTVGLRNHEGIQLPVQARALDHWPDGSIRWLLLDWLASCDGESEYWITFGNTTSKTGNLRVTDLEDGITIDTGVARFRLSKDGRFPFDSVESSGLTFEPDDVDFSIKDSRERRFRPRIDRVVVEESGGIKAVVRLAGKIGNELEIDCTLSFFSSSPTVRFDLTMRNPNCAGHPGGIWSLGSDGAVFLKEAIFTLRLPGELAASDVFYSTEQGSAHRLSGERFEIYQDSSGGENWNGKIHVNREGKVPLRFKGCRIREDDREHFIDRSSPVVAITSDSHSIALAMPLFWQNFPKAVNVERDLIVFGLFPAQHDDVHEIQGGEQKTHRFYASFGRDTVSEEPLEWCHSPLRPHAEPSWYYSSGVFPYLCPRANDGNAGYHDLVDQAIEGDDSFENKRECIDQYGWRHFGEIYADHEAVFHEGHDLLVSHYNNQYDAIAGFCYQYLRSGDQRWWMHIEELTNHVIDIDIYHTAEDKPAYNNGLFWHTVHYIDAGTSAHRTYPKAQGVFGGGPGSGQNYNTGLMLYYYLTGCNRARETAIALGLWGIEMDDGSKTVARFLTRQNTGHATASGPDYHGPGRAAANSISTLLNAHELTKSDEYLDKAEQVIRRCINPNDNIGSLDLLNADRKWFYTMFLQSIGKYLDYKEGLSQVDYMYSYSQACLLHYAGWMLENEFPYLDKPERLEFPTETWAAQDMRKSEVFKFAAMHSRGTLRDQFLSKSEFFFDYSVRKLGSMKTKGLVRPVVLLLNHGFMQAAFRQTVPERELASRPPSGFPPPERFVRQKVIAMRRAIMIATTLLAMSVAVAGTFLFSFLRG